MTGRRQRQNGASADADAEAAPSGPEQAVDDPGQGPVASRRGKGQEALPEHPRALGSGSAQGTPGVSDLQDCKITRVLL